MGEAQNAEMSDFSVFVDGYLGEHIGIRWFLAVEGSVSQDFLVGSRRRIVRKSAILVCCTVDRLGV